MTYTYDNGTNGKGRRTSMSITGADFTQWTYDARGRVMSEAKQITGGGQFVTEFTYNSADLPITMTYPDDEVVSFTYNNNMLPTSVSGTSTYAQTIAYDSANRMIQLIRGANKVNTVYTYNAWNVDGGRLQNLTSTQVSTGDPLQNQTYDYDSVGNINTITDSLFGPQTQTFTYDELDRLTNSTVTGGTDGLYTEGYTYNPNNGNLKTKGSATYTYNAGTHAVASLSNGNTYGYDANGNMTSRHVFEGTEFKDYTLNYDAENRLVSVSGNATASFKYDGDGKQIKATVNGITAVYVGNHYEVKNSIVSKYYFAGATRIAVRKDGTLNYLLSDHLGSSSVTTNMYGTKTASALYKAFGETRYTLGSLNTDYKFTGQREESALGGIYFFQARWYDGSLGRFTSADTMIPSAQGVQAWDRYAYVNNNPVRYTDPTGHMNCEEDGYCPDDEGGCPSDAENCGEAEDLITMLWLAFGGIDQIYLTGDALQLIQSDPRFLEFRSELMAVAMSNPEYGKSDFTFSSGTRSIEFGGERDLSSMFLQFFAPGEYSATQAVGSNELSWMIRHADVNADVQVSKNGQITTSYSLSDQFDLTPSKDRSLEYNFITHILGSIWHGALGASKPYVYANWTTCWGFSC